MEGKSIFLRQITWENIELNYKRSNLDICKKHQIIGKSGFQYEGLLRLAEERYDGVVLDNECYVMIRR
jgi:hypothetical protein